MNDVQVFSFKAFPVRTVTKNGEPWFVAADVCNVLGIGNSRDALGRLPASMRDDVGITDAIGRQQSANAVNEAGVYKLAFTSRKPEAETFTDWVASDVLPSIRRHGMYATPATVEAMLADPDTMIAALQKLKAEQEARRLAEQQLALAAPKVEGYNRLMASGDCISIGKLAKMLGTGQNRLFAFLRGQRVLMDDNTPYQQHIDAGRFKVIEQTWGNGAEPHISHKTLVTPKGQDYIRRIWTTIGAAYKERQGVNS